MTDITLNLLGRYDSGAGEGGAEVVAYDGTSVAYVTNSEDDTLDVIDFNDPTAPMLVTQIDLSALPGYGGVNSVAFSNGLIAVAIENDDEDMNGFIAFYSGGLGFIDTIEVGNLPDMVTFSPDGTKVLVANEGEPTDNGDPMGGVSIIDLETAGSLTNATVTNLDFTAFDGMAADLAAAGVRIFPGELPSTDFEPEYIAVTPDGSEAIVGLQEANAVAIIDLATNTITSIESLGTVDRSLPGFSIDASDRDDDINIQNWPVFGLRMPDALASFEVGGETFFITANEGDARDEDVRIEDLILDTDAFGNNAVFLQDDLTLGRLDVSAIDGDTDGDGDYDQLFAYGARSFTIFDNEGNVVFDSGNLFETITAGQRPEFFNSDDGDADNFDNRSDAKGPEPEAVAVGEVDGEMYAFIGLERIGGIMVFNIEDPANPEFSQWFDPLTDDIGPEIITFVAAEDSPTGNPFLLVASEVSGTTAAYGITVDAQDNPDFLSYGPYDIRESAQPGDVVGDVDAEGEGSGTVYSLMGGDGQFEIDPATGVITVAAGADPFGGETATDTFTLDVTATLGEGSTTESVEVSVEENFKLQILHASDLEGGVDAIGRAPNFAALVDFFEQEADDEGFASILLSAGDNYIPGPFFNASGDFSNSALFEGFYNELFGLIDTDELEEGDDTDGNGFFSNDEIQAVINDEMRDVDFDDVYTTDVNGDGFADYFEEIDTNEGRIDVSIMNALGFDASAVGNHEFDNGTDTFENIINYDSEEGNSLSGGRYGTVNYLQEVDWPGIQFPYLTSNLDFSEDFDVGPLFTDEILPNTAFQSDLLSARDFPEDPAMRGSDSNDIKGAQATVINRGDEKIGVIGATTQIVETISSTGNVSDVTGGANDMQALADVLQPIIDAMIQQEGLNKVVLVSHLQQFALEQELAGLLDGVDVIIAGGSDTINANDDDVLRAGDEADLPYPVVTTDLSGNPVAIVSTDGEYSYLGRLVVEFNDQGILVDGEGNPLSSFEDLDLALNGPVSTDDANVLDVLGMAEGTIEEAIAASDVATDVKNLVDGVTDIVIASDSNVFGETTVFLDGERSQVRTEETNLGNLTADANLAEAQKVDADVLVSLKNGGGIRAPIGEIDSETGEELVVQANPLSGKEEGEVSQLDIENTLRFNNGLTLVTLTLEQLQQVLEHAVAGSGDGNTPGQFAQVGGINFSFDDDRPVGERVLNATIETANGPIPFILDGEILPTAQETFADGIRVVTLNFLADGGDGYPYDEFQAADPEFFDRLDLTGNATLAEGGVADFATAGTEQDALAEFLAENFPIDGDTSFDEEETDPSEDTRIQNLDAREDDVVGDEAVAALGGGVQIDQSGQNNGDKTSDDLFGSNLDDFIRGGKGDDLIIGFDGDDELHGGEGDDVIYGGEGDDFIFAGAGEDQVFGGEGNDELLGRNSDDILDGGSGDDLLVGGKGTDTFVFGLGYGNDVVEDFKANKEFLDLDGQIADFGDFLAGAAQVGKDVVFTAADGGTLTLLKTDLDDMSADNFIFG